MFRFRDSFGHFLVTFSDASVTLFVAFVPSSLFLLRQGDKNSECKLSNLWSRSYKVIELLLSAGKWVAAKLQGDTSASQSDFHGALLPMDFWTPFACSEGV